MNLRLDPRLPAHTRSLPQSMTAAVAPPERPSLPLKLLLKPQKHSSNSMASLQKVALLPVLHADVRLIVGSGQPMSISYHTVARRSVSAPTTSTLLNRIQKQPLLNRLGVDEPAPKAKPYVYIYAQAMHLTHVTVAPSGLKHRGTVNPQQNRRLRNPRLQKTSTRSWRLSWVMQSPHRTWRWPPRCFD